MQRAGANIRKVRCVTENRFAAYAYKPKKADMVPFGMETTTSSLLGEILEADIGLKDTVTSLMAQAKSSGTMENYGRITQKFADFCSEKDYTYPKYTEKAALHFVIQCDKDKVSHAMLCQIKPALFLVEQMSGNEGSAWSELVNIFLIAAKRRAAIEKQPIQKAGILPEDTLFRLYPVCYQPHLNNVKTADPVMLRTIVRTVVVYFTFCRFNCYNKLQAQDFEDQGHSIQITFRSAKNDQFHNGQSTYIVENDSIVNPVAIVRTYFRLCGFKFGVKNGDLSFVNCVMRRSKTGWHADGRKSISYSTGTRNIRSMLMAVGISADKASDKSFKMLGVTRTLEAGTSLEVVRCQGRWKTLSMPLHYKVNSAQYKEQVASQVPP
jgi:hypothetical protein